MRVSATVLVLATLLLIPLAGILVFGRGKTQPPPDQKDSYTLSAIGSGLAVFGLALLGGLYLEVPGLILTVVGWVRGEKHAGKAVMVCVICILLQVILMLGLTLLRIFTYR
jgi:hypothetical protein